MWYAIRGFDHAGSGERRRQTRPEHLARLDRLRDEGRILTAGPILARHAADGGDPAAPESIGSLMILDFESIEAARAWADAEPYLVAGVFQRVTVEPYMPVLP